MRSVITTILFFIATAIHGQTNTLANNDSLKTGLPPDKFIYENLIGTWKDQNSTTYFWADSTYNVKFDNFRTEIGKWEISGGRIFFFVQPLNLLGKIRQKIDHTDEYIILHFTAKTMHYQLAYKGGDRTIWVANKTGQPMTRWYGEVQNEIGFDNEKITVVEVDSIASALARTHFFDAAIKKTIYLKKEAENYVLRIKCKESIKDDPIALAEFTRIKKELQQSFHKNKIILCLSAGKPGCIIKIE